MSILTKVLLSWTLFGGTSHAFSDDILIQHDFSEDIFEETLNGILVEILGENPIELHRITMSIRKRCMGFEGNT